MATFVLRLAGSGGSDLHGVVRHVTTGVTRTFTDPTQLFAFLEEWTATDGLGAEPGDRPTPSRGPRTSGSFGPPTQARPSGPGNYREEDSSCGP
jgi:hypothetical protein